MDQSVAQISDHMIKSGSARQFQMMLACPNGQFGHQTMLHKLYVDVGRCVQCAEASLGMCVCVCESPYLQGCASGPVAVAVQLLLTLRGVELHQLFTLHLIRGESGQELKEGAAGHGGNIQIFFQQVAHRARLRNPARD